MDVSAACWGGAGVSLAGDISPAGGCSAAGGVVELSDGTSVASRLITVGGRRLRPPGGSDGGRFALAMRTF